MATKKTSGLIDEDVCNWSKGDVCSTINIKLRTFNHPITETIKRTIDGPTDILGFRKKFVKNTRIVIKMMESELLLLKILI